MTEPETAIRQVPVDRSIGVGSSVLADARSAALQATEQAIGPLEPKLLVVLASSRIDQEALLGGIREAARGVPMIGCTTSGEISGGGPAHSGVVVMAIGGDGFSIATGIGEIEGDDLRGAAARAARCASEVEDRESKVLLLLSDGLAGDQQEVVRGAYQQVGATLPLVGGCAGDDMEMEQTFQYFGDRVVRRSVVAAAISSDAPIGIGVNHGWQPVGVPMVVTESEGVVVHRLDDKPALDVYLDRFDAPADVRSDPAAFTRFAETRPLGLSRRSGDEIRFVATANFEQRSIQCFAEVPQGGTCSIMNGDAESILQATEDACGEALAPLDGSEPTGMLVFDCIARKGVLGDEGIEREVGRISSHSRGAPVAGFYTYGEIARVSGATGFHNQTLVVLALG
ncbi:MAG: hypothetical protein GY812_13730 [Actinomycetia bacterium]|nr:hypothetical protein [Actinomycetes bacterium]